MCNSSLRAAWTSHVPYRGRRGLDPSQRCRDSRPARQTGMPRHMSTPGVPRRDVMKLGAAVIAYGLFATPSHASTDDPLPSPAVAQRPARGPTSASAAGTLTQGVWLWQRTGYSDG